MKLKWTFLLVAITLSLFVPVGFIYQEQLEEIRLVNPLPSPTFIEFLEHLTNWLFWFGVSTGSPFYSYRRLLFFNSRREVSINRDGQKYNPLHLSRFTGIDNGERSS